MPNTKKFKISHIASLLECFGYNGGPASDNIIFETLTDLRKNLKKYTNLIPIELIDNCKNDANANSVFTIIFLDPSDQCHYSASCGYFKLESGPPYWYHLNTLNEEVDSDDLWSFLHETEASVSIECTKVEKKQIIVEQWIPIVNDQL